jgi:DNA-directed RNA polymerase subunit N (RpoN/RPB10)
MLPLRCPSCQSLLADKQIPWENAISAQVDNFTDKSNTIKKKYEDKKSKTSNDFDHDKLDAEEVTELKKLNHEHENAIEKILDNLFVKRLCCRMRVITYVNLVEIIK